MPLDTQKITTAFLRYEIVGYLFANSGQRIGSTLTEKPYTLTT
jgi:hypothetical protein